MKLFNKSGAWAHYLTTAVLAILALIILIFVVINLGEGINQGGEVANCQTWVDLKSKKILGDNVPVADESPCYTFVSEVNPSKIDVYDTVARELYACANMYRFGEKDFYSDWSGWSRAGDIKYCHVCSDLIFEESFVFDNKKFITYLAENSPPNVAGKNPEDRTYLEVFSDSKNPIDLSSLQSDNIDIGAGERFYVSFAAVKFGTDLSFFQRVVAGTVAIGAGAAGGAAIGSVGSVPGAVAGGTIGLAIAVTREVSQITGIGAKREFAPGFIWGKEDSLNSFCDEIYYKPKKSFFDPKSLFGGEDG